MKNIFIRIAFFAATAGLFASTVMAQATAKLATEASVPTGPTTPMSAEQFATFKNSVLTHLKQREDSIKASRACAETAANAEALRQCMQLSRRGLERSKAQTLEGKAAGGAVAPAKRAP